MIEMPGQNRLTIATMHASPSEHLTVPGRIGDEFLMIRQ
jgi:hypothetical protein